MGNLFVLDAELRVVDVVGLATLRGMVRHMEGKLGREDHMRRVNIDGRSLH